MTIQKIQKRCTWLQDLISTKISDKIFAQISKIREQKTHYLHANGFKNTKMRSLGADTFGPWEYKKKLTF